MKAPAESKPKTPLPYGLILHQVLKARAGDRRALSSAFVWGDTPQGHSFWASAHEAMLNGAPLPDDAAAALGAMIAEAKARGGVIAAAPDLYAAASEIIRLHDTYTGEARDDDAISLAMDELRAALRRARGGG